VTRAEAQARRPAAAEATPPAGNGGATPPQAGRPPGAGVEDAATLARRAAREARAPESAVRLLGAGPDPQTTWALSNRGRDRAALVLLQARYGWEQVVLEDPDADISQAWISRVSRTPLLAVGNAGYPRTTFLDDALRRELQPLFGRFSGEPLGIDIQGADRAERRLLVRLHTSTWGRTWLVDRDGGKFEPQDGDDDAFTRLLSPMRPFAIKARDGLHLRGFLTLPQGVPPRGLPMVLLVHGGPWAQTLWSEPSRSEDSTRVQFLANRGYAVLQVDFRGSTGYGKAHQHAAIGEFAGRMQDDLSDAVQWAVAQGIADPAKVAIMGLSYGGYAALTGLASTPKTYACGISIGGPTDLATLIESFPPYWKTDLSTWHDFVGDPRIPAERADMTRRSPLTHAARIERPVLIIHGGRDVRVRPDQSQRMAAALAAAGRPVRLVMLPDMGHNPSWWAHQYQVLRETETFLAGCLGGRASAFDWFDPLVWAWTRLSR
jgi:dipeptidyl aminopeptidase/acylaminoacyl peptidase